MFGIIYLILCILTGMEMVGCLFPHQTTEKGNRIWVILPAAFGTGTLMLTWAVYIVSWIFSVCVGTEHPLFYGNLLVMLVTALIFLMNFHRKRKNGKTVFSAGEPGTALLTGNRKMRIKCWQSGEVLDLVKPRQQ